MFAVTGHKSSKNETRATPGNAKPETKAADSAKVNPLWQSLAMRAGIVQPRLTIGQADDPYEREADRVAEQVMRMPAPPSEGHALSITPVTSRRAQRKCAECDEEEVEGALQRKESSSAEAPAAAPPIVHQALSSPGQPLDAETRAYFEPRFGHDFSDVRIHAGGEAAAATQAVRARAFTISQDIAFAHGQYAPDRSEGRRLLAHELTHVVQQQRSSSTMLQRQELPEPLDPRIAQAQAEAVAAINQATERLRNAIEARGNGLPMPADVEYAVARFFPGIEIIYGSLEDLLNRVEPMAQWLPEIPVRIILPPISPNDPYQEQHTSAIKNSVHAAAYAGNYIALYPAWTWDVNADLRATQLLHEAYHYEFSAGAAFPPIVHTGPKNPIEESPWENAFAYQGLVSFLGELKTGPLVNKAFPP